RVVERFAVEVGMLAMKRRSLGDFGRVRGRHQHVHEQRIGIKRDRRDELLETLLRELRSLFAGGSRGSVGISRRTRTAGSSRWLSRFALCGRCATGIGWSAEILARCTVGGLFAADVRGL